MFTNSPFFADFCILIVQFGHIFPVAVNFSPFFRIYVEKKIFLHTPQKSARSSLEALFFDALGALCVSIRFLDAIPCH